MFRDQPARDIACQDCPILEALIAAVEDRRALMERLEQFEKQALIQSFLSQGTSVPREV